MRDSVHSLCTALVFGSLAGAGPACSGDGAGDPGGGAGTGAVLGGGAAPAGSKGGASGATGVMAAGGSGALVASASGGASVPARAGSTGLSPAGSSGAGLGGASSGQGGRGGQSGRGGASGGSAGASGGFGGASGAGSASPPAGPKDGDPSRPVVAIANIPCGPRPSLLGLTETNAKIGSRDVHVAYPCNKHEGAPVTFVLNLHGTMPTENLKLYQVAYFSINTLVDSHNIITVAPKSVVSQWGNGDGGADEPHLREVIAWVYETFGKLDIRGMWVGGHSWGAMYTSTFGCKAELADKVKGLIIMSGLETLPSCAARVAVIDTVAEDDIAGPMDQKMVPAQHGCAAPQEIKLGNNEQTLWPDCQPGFVHANYFMLGKGHADYMDAEVVESIADLIVESRL